MSFVIEGRKQLMPRRKRARTEDESTISLSFASSDSSTINKNTSKASASNVLRAKKISNRLSALLKEFPDVKFIFDFENLQSITETAVVKYAEEKEAKKRNAQLDMNYKEKLVPLYSLPDEVLSNCLSFVGNGYYGVVGLVSKKLNAAYKDEVGRETAYLEMATSIELSNYCLSELCKNLKEKDEILKAAAVNGNLDILRAAVKDGYELFPLVAMEKDTFYLHADEIPNIIADSDEDVDHEEDYHYDDSYLECDIYYADDDERQYSWKPQKVKLSKLVERGHLHVLKYLYEELNYVLGLQRYCKPAIEYGQLEILEWLVHIGDTEDDNLCIGFIENGKLDFLHFGECAIKSGNVESLELLIEMDYRTHSDDFDVLPEAIRSKSTDMIQYCFDLGFDNLAEDGVHDAIKKTNSAEVFRKMHELGYEFDEMKKWYDKYRLKDYFEIIKFLRSISVPWDDGIMKEIVKYGTLEMIQFAHEDGCPWTGEEYSHLFSNWNLDLGKFKYLIDNNCTVDYTQSSDLIRGLRSKKELELLDYFVGKNSSFDNKLFKELFAGYVCDPWFEGISYLLEKGKDIEKFKSLEEVFQKHNQIDGIKYFHSLNLPWCLDSSRNTQLLSKIACYNDLEDVKWAYQNGCKGGNVVPYVEKEWKENGIRDSRTWKANQVFFEKNGLLDEAILGMSGIKKLDPKNIQEIGDDKLESIHDWFLIDFTLLKNLVDHGYMFASESEQRTICREAFQKCCEDSNKMNRKRLALFVGIGVRDL